MPSAEITAKKQEYGDRLTALSKAHKSIMFCNVDNVGSNQMHQIRKSLRGEGVVLMGKNTMVRKVLRGLASDQPELERIIPLVRGNVGFVFTNGDLKEVREKITSNRVRAPAKAGALAPGDVIVPAGNTGMEPGKTSFFQALGIPTKIARGTIEIVSDVHLVKKNTRVSPSEAALLNMLNISPFTFGLTVKWIFDGGNVFDPSLLDITDDYLVERMMAGIQEMACLSLALHYPTIAAVPHWVINGFKDLVGISLTSDYCIEQVKELKELLDNPEALAAATQAAAASAAPAAAAGGKKESAAKKEETEEEEEDDDMGFGLFD